MIFSSVIAGLHRAWSAKRMIAIYYVANLLCGMALALPLRSFLNTHIGTTLLGEALGGRVDMNIVADIINDHPDLFTTWSGLLWLVPAFYLFSNLFLSGGALSVFATEEKYSSTLFWSGAAKHFSRFVRLWLLALPLFGVLFLIMYLATGLTRLFFGPDPYQYITFWAGWARVGLFALAAALSYMYFDYARIYAVLHDEPLMRSVWWHGLKFTLRNIGQALLLVIALALLGVLVLGIYALVADRLATPSVLVVGALVALQQLYMMFRVFLKLAGFAAQAHFYHELSVAPPVVESISAEAARGFPEAFSAEPTAS